MLGCILASEPCVAETKEALLKQSIITNIQTDFSSDDEQNVVQSDVPWLLNKCIMNSTTPSIPAPVKLESLQVMSVMSRNYFTAIMADHIVSMGNAIESALTDKHVELRLHGGRAVDFLGVAMEKYFVENPEAVEEGVQFWMILLKGPLVELLQDEQNVALRAVGCDCLGSIGAKVFERLPVSNFFTFLFLPSSIVLLTKKICSNSTNAIS